MMVQTRQIYNHKKGWYFRLDDNNKVGYKYILSIT